jgi:hypothetical protein
MISGVLKVNTAFLFKEQESLALEDERGAFFGNIVHH